MSQIFCIIKLIDGENINLLVQDGQTRRYLTPGKPVKVKQESYLAIKDKEYRVELVEEIIQAGDEQLVIDERINEAMIASYEDQLKRERIKVADRDRHIRRLNRKIASLRDELSMPATMVAYQIMGLHYSKRVDKIQKLEDVESVRKIINLVQAKPSTQRSKTEKECLNAARLRLAELEKKIPELEEVPEVTEEVEIDDDIELNMVINLEEE